MKRFIKTQSEIKAMRESGKMLASILQLLKKKTEIGMTTKDLSVIADLELKKLGGKPAFLGYNGFPDIICISVNEEVVHGIPSSTKIIRDGDIVSLDFGVIYKGMITDSAISFTIGKAVKEDIDLVKATEESLQKGLSILKNGTKIGTLGHTIELVLEDHNLGVVRDLVGHGVGHELHEDPSIPNYGRENTGMTLLSGMTIAVEPMATLGSYKVFISKDGWTILTQDGSRSAHFEHSVLITDKGCDILTAIPTDS